MHVASPIAVGPHEYAFSDGIRNENTLSVFGDDQPTQQAARYDAATAEHADQDDSLSEIDEEEDAKLEDDTRLRYERLQARGRAAELAFGLKLQREKDEAAAAAAAAASAATAGRSKSRSKSRSRPGTPMLGGLFKRDNFVLPLTRSHSPPIPSVEKPVRRPSITNMFKLKPLSRSSSSNNCSSTSSSQATSPFSSPRTPMTPLPSFLSPKTRRKAIPQTGEDVVDHQFGSPLVRTSRRPSPQRAFTLPLPMDDTDALGLHHGAGRPVAYGAVSHVPSRGRNRDDSPPGWSNDPAAGPHLTYAG